MKNFTLPSLGIVVCLLLACTAQTNQQEAYQQSPAMQPPTEALAHQVRTVSPPIDHVQAPAQTFAAETPASESYTYDLPSGTRVHIPASALVDISGQPVTEAVSVSLRVYHDAVDMLLSGIPMVYDSAGQSHVLQSAGMLEIRASHNGKPVFIDAEKGVEVEMASYVQGSFNLYRLDEENGNWAYMQQDRPSPNPRKAPDNAAAEMPPQPAKPFKPRTPAADEPIFPIDASTRNFPELAYFEELDWQWAGIEEEGCLIPSQAEWVFAQSWSKVDLRPKRGYQGVFYLYMTDGSKKVKMLITPAVSEEAYETALARYETAISQREAMLARLEAERRQRAMQAEMIRSFRIQQFGIYNWDIIWKMEDKRQVVAQFEVALPEAAQELEISRVYHIMPDINAVVPYDKGTGSLYGSWGSFTFSPSTSNKLLAILPGMRVAIFDEEDFARARIEGKSYTFRMRSLPQRINSPEELRALLGVGV